MSEELQKLGSEQADVKEDIGRRQVGGAELSRRRLLRMTAYVAPFVLTFGTPRSSDACGQLSPCTCNWPKPKWPRRCWWCWS